jgi:hypothetical protein
VSATHTDERPSSLRRFDSIRLQTECGFARGAELWGSDEWPAGGLEPAVAAFAQLLVRLVTQADPPDGAVLEVCDPGAGASVEALARTTREVIARLRRLDPGPRLDVPVDDPDWWFTFAGERFFVVTFGPCYGPESSRYAFGLDATYLLFQTRSSFVQRWAPGTDRLPDRARKAIRRDFEAAGRRYDLAITLSPFEAHRIVKPARLGEPPVRWWIKEDGER